MTIYNKLIRDRIPEIIKSKGEMPKIRLANNDEFREKLLDKLREESAEFSINSSREELADILEVIDEIFDFFGYSEAEVDAIKEQKKTECGAFKKRIILEES